MRRSIAILVFVYHLSMCNGSCKHGRTILTNETGVISDGENTTTYPSYARCEWMIDAKHPNKSIYLEFEFLDTECSYDFLFVFDGDSYLSPTLASLSGQHRPGPIVAKSGKMLVYLFSDRNYERTGFRARYSMQDCPFNCTGHGNCIGHQCYCFMGRTGNYCQLEECPQNCSSHGACVMKDDNSTYKCQCEKGYAGYMCNISLNNSEGSELWYTLLPEGMGLEPRSAHAGAFVSRTECLYVFGGFSLNKVLSDLNYYCINETTWNSINRSEPWPKGRYEHAIELFEDGFYMFGGMLDDENYSDELWFFNVTSETWTLCANESVFKPLKLSGHTLTRVEDDLYVFGGKTKDGLFWSNIYKINGHIPTEWQEVLPLAGKSSARRLVGHSTVYHKESKSLLIYGGYSHNADEPRYGSHKDELHMFHVENKIWSKIKTNEALDNGPAPSQRSFHSANIMGNYMVVFGGNTHIHHDVEKCYDYEIYLYHLGCHIWVKAELLMGKYSSALDDGRVSHVAAVAYGNTLLVAGGYAGYVKGDVMAFKFPPLIAPPSSEVSLDLDYCTNITLADKCQSNPDCLLCTKQGRCMHRTHITEQLCGPLKAGVPYMQCPGICSRLSSCVSCLSQGQGAARSQDSPEHWTYIQPCNWCVKEGECQLRSKPTGNCAAATSTPSGLVGWWGDKSLSLSQIAQCRLEDKPAGLVEVKCRSGNVNFNQPDEVSILRQTNTFEKYRRIYTRPLLKSFTRWRGWIHPLNATVKHLIDPSPKQFMLKLAVDNIAVKVWLNKDAIVGRKERIMNIGIGDNPLELKSRADNSLLFPNTSPGTRYYLDLEGEYLYPSSTNSQPAINEKLYSIELKWDGSATNGNSLSVLHAFSFEFLEPYSVGDCANFTSCLACMTDTACGWCDVEARCMPRNTSTSACAQEGHQLMITEPSVCTVCDDHVECLSCAKDPHCEWVKDKVHCIRRGRGLDTEIAAIPEQCPASCHELSSCSQCLNVSECAWCESLRSCLPFYDYVIRHRHGQCTEWVDSEITRNDNTYSCRNCSILKSCESCMKSFNCGWCGNRANPKKGVCFEGDFAGPFGNVTCSAIVNSQPSGSFATDVEADWSYGKCPDVNECALGLAKCHENASCVDTPDSYVCNCNRGYEGDGIMCSKTCYYKCAHGECLYDMGNYYCDCNLGWTGKDCNDDCKCNGHSMCEAGVGICDLCLNKTTGPYCNQCLVGHYGDPTKSYGCYQCQCNGHGNETLGQCNNITGECYCTHHTMEYNCERCEKGYYGDPRDGGTCYRECDHGLIMDNLQDGALGSHRGLGVSTWHAYCLWILMSQNRFTRPSTPWAARALSVPSITLQVEGLDVECERDHVYVYDGIPAFIDSAGSGLLLGAFCGSSATDLENVTAKSGIMTVYFDADISGEYSSTKGFNASYIVNRCPSSCDVASNQQCLHGNCVCADGYEGFPDCKIQTCARGYTYDKTLNACQSDHPIGSVSYHITRYSVVPPEGSVPFDVRGTGAGPVPRYGHTLIDCTTSVFLFGGRSLKYGLLNDIWEFDFRVGTWTEIKPVSSEPPSPRYFHAASCIPSKKIFFIFGGLVAASHERHETSKEMWKFAIDARKWTGPIQPIWVSPVAGHTMTLANESKLVIIGGFSSEDYFNDVVYVYDTYPYPTVWERHGTDNVTGAKPTGIYGHSAVYDSTSKTVYVYGGHVFRDERFAVSKYLFTYDIETNSWSILQPDLGDLTFALDGALYRYFHMAQGFKDYMVVVGGYDQHHEPQNSLFVYNYRCNYWHQIPLADEEGMHISSLVSASSVVYNNSLYIFGGIGTNIEGNMYRLKIPEDICGMYSAANLSIPACLNVVGCSAAILRIRDVERTVCFSTEVPPIAREGPYVSMHKGAASVCDEDHHKDRDCERIMNCSECVATYPYFKNAPKTCKWCSNCLIGRCIKRGSTCSNNHGCDVFQIKGGVPQVSPSQPGCPVKSCLASTCKRCLEKDCLWTKGITRQTIGPLFPSQGWTCLPQMYQSFRNGSVATVISKPGDCPAPCQDHKLCETCLGSKGSEGGSLECYWSVTLAECIPPAYTSLHCLGGVCGTLLQGEPGRCPAPCSTYTKCADCRRAPGCGWCAHGGENGVGVCSPGTLSGPEHSEMCAKKNSVFTDKDSYARDPHWSYGTCPPEDECRNGHHACDLETEDCSDLSDGFLCTCKKGYIRGEDEGRSICNPVCHQACVHGTCVKPDTCDCHFGYIGKNCSTKCECNGHSTCRSEEEKNICLNCTDNTQGSQCQECKPLYVGDPKDGGHCTSCTEFCNEHSDVCIRFNHYAKSAQIMGLLERFKDVKSPGFMSEFMRLQSSGPRLKNETICLNCQHHTKDDRCETCLPGYFRRPGMKPEEPCMKCMCNGHSDMCNDKSGENCQCQNNTDTKCSVEQGNTDPKCHEKQCAECKDYFLGRPKSGHQCYRTMTVSKDYCLDPKTQLECTRNPSPLLHGSTVFFVAQPKYVNVDIRITIDVTEGGVDVFFSPYDDTFVVHPDRQTGKHIVSLDPNYLKYEQTRRKRSDNSDLSISELQIPVIQTIKAVSLNTFFTVHSPDEVLIIRNLQGRLVITLPNEKLNLKTSKFFMVFLSTGNADKNDTLGNIYFRQDQPHIDLFVFFSVFFSCFFLFLAVCVLLWKTKQAVDARRNRQQRAREMLHMASRPFAKVLVHIDHPITPFNVSPNLRVRQVRKPTEKTPFLSSDAHLQYSPPLNVRGKFEITPIAMEPTDDCLAAVGTIVLQLPGGPSAPSHLCLASALIYQSSAPGKHRRMHNV